MKFALCLFIASLVNINASAQADTWTAFWNADSSLYGFKDKRGATRISPRFETFGVAQKFADVMAAIEKKNGAFEVYYLNKAGKEFGRDSVFFFDNTPDCESEGFIRFRDSASDRAGLFNRTGMVVVPARYNYLGRVMNGLLVALQGAVKKQDGEHYFWEGGETLLLDTTGKELIKPFKESRTLNFYSLKIADKPDPDPNRVNYAGLDGRYYSFIDYEREFRTWLTALIDKADQHNLLQNTFSQVSYYTGDTGWVSVPAEKFIKTHFDLIQKRLLQLTRPGCDSAIFYDGLNPYIYTTERYQQYFNNCGEAKDGQYPVVTVTISYKNGNTYLKQDAFDFLRTDEGYKLISFNFPGTEIR
ncbi:MAG: hypothetical protein QM640_00550 [Niabella sp.]